MSKQLEYWREHFSGAAVTIKDGGHRIHIQRANKCGGWMEFVAASGQLIIVGDWEPIIFRDYRDRDLVGWLKQIADTYAQSPGYGAEKIGIGMSSWWSAALNVAGSPICDLELAQHQAVKYLNEWLNEGIDEDEKPAPARAAQVKEATRAVNSADTLDEVYSAVMAVDPSAFEAKFGRTAPEGLWRAIAGAEVILAHLDALKVQAAGGEA